MDRNQATFESRLVVMRYALERALQRPETTILGLLREELPRMRMLDIGVGGGRTTRHFGELVRRYVGIDYSARMIAACRRSFGGRGGDLSFRVCDARDLSCFAGGEFDLVLASFNSLDSVGHEDRLRVLTEVRRVLAPGGTLCFSSHNIRSLTPGRPGRAVLRHPVRSLCRAMRYLQIRLLHPGLPSDSKGDFAVVRDLPRHRAYYVRPEVQLEQLAVAGFQEIRCFSLEDGDEITGRRELEASEEKWIYYLCKRRPGPVDEAESHGRAAQGED